MRRTRHMVLPVRSWQYIGFLIVSLACLTLGLVSRDREGHAGSLAGPELEHRAPHEMDVCPNLNPLSEMPSHAIKLKKPEETAKSINDREKVLRSEVSPASRRSVFTRSLSLDRSSRIGSYDIREQSFRNWNLQVETLSRSRSRVTNNESTNRLRESRFGTIARSRDAGNVAVKPAARLSRSRDLSYRANDHRSDEYKLLNFNRRSTDFTNYRAEDHRSRATERRDANEITRRINYVDLSMDRRNSANLQHRMNARDHRDRRLLSTERRVLNKINRRESREALTDRRESQDLTRDRVDQSEMRERRFRVDKQRELNNIERHAVEVHRDTNRSNYREDRRSLLDRSARIVERNVERKNNLDRNRARLSRETRHVLLDRVVNQERASRFLVNRNSRKNLVRSNDRRSFSRMMERSDISDFAREIFGRRVRSVEYNNKKSSDYRLSAERREINYAEHRSAESRVRDQRSVDRETMRIISENIRQERTDRLQRNVNHRNTAIRENSRTNTPREVRSRYNLEENRERRERLVRYFRSLDRNSLARQELSRTRDVRDHDRIPYDFSRRQELVPGRQERTDRSYRSHEERRDNFREKSQNSKENFEQRIVGRVLERRVSYERGLERSREGFLARRVALESARLDLRRSSERRLNDNSRSRGEFRRADRRFEQNTELRVSRNRISEKRFALDSQIRAKSSERTNGEILRLHEGIRLQNNYRLERNLELTDLISTRVPERWRMSSRMSVDRDRALRTERKSDAQRDFQIRNLKERRVAKSIENKLTEIPARESARQLRQRLSNLRVTNPSRLISLRRVVSPVSEQNQEQRRLFAERMLSRLADNNKLFAKWEKNLQEALADRNTNRNADVRAKIVAIKNDKFLKYFEMYEFIRQAVVIALCAVYGLSLYNGKKSFIRSNMTQQLQRFMVW